MKKLILALSVAAVAAVQAADLKIATVDVLVLVRNHPDYDRNERFMESKSKDLEAKGDMIKAEGETLQAEGKKLLDQLRNPMLNEKGKMEVEKKLQDLQQKLYQVEQRYRTEMLRGNQELQDDRTRLMKATTDDLRLKLKNFAEAHELDLILDTNVVAYSKDAFDVTDYVLKDMGVDPAKAKTKEQIKNESK